MNIIAPTKRLTVGVAAHGNVGVTTECLKSIFESISTDFDLILVNDASPDEMIKLFSDAKNYHKNTTIFDFTENLEYTNSVNCILSHAQTDLILFVSNDIFITPAYVESLLSTINNDDIGIARGVSNFVDVRGSKVHNKKIDMTINGYDDLVRFSELQARKGSSKLTDDRWLTGDAFMVRKQIIDRIGTYDTQFVGYFSDIDFGIRATQAGYRKVVCDKAFAWHIQDANFNYLPDSERQAKIERRFARVSEAWKKFRTKWNLNDIPELWHRSNLWKTPYQYLDSLPYSSDYSYIKPMDYSRFISS